MYQFAPGGVKFKIFVKETEKSAPEQQPNNNKYFCVSPLTGDKAKELYEDILKESTIEKKCLAKAKPKSKPPARVVESNFRNRDLLWMAQNNDVKSLNRFLAEKRDPDLNVVDDFGWTPLMCASCSGAEEAVEWLLENGADPHACDRLGNTALGLARRKNQKRIAEKLENYKSEPEPDGETVDESKVEPFFCTTCKENFTMRRANHESSTVHLFNLSRLKTSTYYAIPECNKGFQLLLRKGWDREKGLGRDGTGRKFPVKAVVKKDRLGIGAPAPPADRNKGEVRHTEKYESKRRRMSKMSREKDFEKNFRLEFS